MSQSDGICSLAAETERATIMERVAAPMSSAGVRSISLAAGLAVLLLALPTLAAPPPHYAGRVQLAQVQLAQATGHASPRGGYPVPRLNQGRGAPYVGRTPSGAVGPTPGVPQGVRQPGATGVRPAIGVAPPLAIVVPRVGESRRHDASRHNGWRHDDRGADRNHAGRRYDRAHIRRHGRHHAWAPGVSFWFYDGYYHGNCDWLRDRAEATGVRYWWERYRQCRAW